MKDPVESFMETVRLYPNHAAVVQDMSSVSYGEIGSVAARIAASISNICEKPKVLIYLPKGADAYAAMFATLMAGGYYSPINMDAPVNRHLEILRQFCPDVVVSTKKLLSDLPVADKAIAFVDIDKLSSDELAEPLAAHELAYVMFTSGSTGQPKGVMIPRTGLAHYTEWVLNSMVISPEDRWSQHPNIAFDLSVLDIYGALCGGATLYPLISKKDKLIPADFIRRNQLTIWNSVPSVIDLMMKARHVTKEYFASLRLLTFCGEPLYPKHLDAIFCANNRVLVHNTYGPTEATVSCTLICLTESNYKDGCGSSVALGHPISGMGMMLMGGSSDEGELVILGEQLALGYWKNEAETAKSFISVSVENTERRAYRTGDWVRKRDGQYYFAGRIDSQVKIRGNRVELDEIDLAIFHLGYGNSCTVFVNNQLHSFIQTKRLPALVKFKKALAGYLPEYEIPDHIHAIEHFPVNSNDKIDRLKLGELISAMQVNKKVGEHEHEYE
jgi:D-alanine--poly(phosphoribitol) ligase subunit 1